MGPGVIFLLLETISEGMNGHPNWLRFIGNILAAIFISAQTFFIFHNSKVTVFFRAKLFPTLFGKPRTDFLSRTLLDNRDEAPDS